MIRQPAMEQANADRTRQYLATRIDAYVGKGCHRSASLATLAMAMLDRISPVPVEAFSATDAIVRLGDLLHSGGEEALGAIDPAVILQIHLSGPGGQRPRVFGRLIERIRSEFSAVGNGSDPTGRLAYVGHLLREAGLATDAPPRVQTAWVDAQTLLLMETTELSAFANRAWTHEGPMPQELRDAVELVALSEFRKYRIDVGCRLMRTALQHGGPGPYGRECMHFLALQRRYDGSYGHLNLLKEGADVPDPDAMVHLPTTANVLAVLAA